MVELSGRQRAAAVLAQLDPARAAVVLARLSEAEAISLGTEVARLPVLDQDVLEEIVDGLCRRLDQLAAYRGGEEAAMAFLTARFGATRANAIMEELRSAGRARPFAFLSSVEATQLARFVEDEHPQLIAAVLVQLDHEHAGQVLDQLPAVTRTEVTRRVATMQGLSQGATERLHAELEARLLSIATARADALVADGMETVVGILTSVDQPIERQVLEQLAESAPEVAEAIRSRLFTFDDLAALDDRTLQEVLRQASHDTLVLALKGKPEELVARFSAQLTQRRSEQLGEDLAALPPQHLRDVQQAEAALVRLVLSLEEQEVIQLNRSNDPMLA